MGASRALTSSFGIAKSNNGCADRLRSDDGLLLLLLLLPLLLLLRPLPKDIDCMQERLKLGRCLY